LSYSSNSDNHSIRLVRIWIPSPACRCHIRIYCDFCLQNLCLQGSLHVVRSIYQHEGIGAIYRGFLLAQMVWGPYNAVYLPLWEATKRACVWYSGAESVEKLNIHYELGSSFLSSAFAAGLTNPMVSLSPSLSLFFFFFFSTFNAI